VSLKGGIAVVEDEQAIALREAAEAKAAAAAAKAAAAAARVAPRQVASAPPPPEPEDDGISLPEGFHLALSDSPQVSPAQLGQQGTMAAVSPSRRAPMAARSDGPSNAKAASGLSRYQRIAELGRGAMGVVYQGRDLVLERDVAIKIISDEVRQNQQALDMFFQEAKSMASLNHPNLVTVFDQGSDGDETFLVMELVEGQTLEQVLQTRGTLPLGEALGIVEQLTAGLAYAHGRRILHRDIKPANIFVSNDGVVKIGDFGLARAVRQARLTQTKVCGTPLYMSPEQIRGAGVDFRSDLYSVGCTLFEIVTGRPPFVTGEVMYHHMYTRPPSPSEIDAKIPKEIDQLVLSCLEKEMDKRVATADLLRATIRTLRDRYTVM
jgi:serine/threonine protein kinase